MQSPRPQQQAIPLAQRSRLCVECWLQFTHDPRTCSGCGAPRPMGGWSSMPYRFMGRFEFEQQLGRGGMGAVFRARNLETGASVAIKVAQNLGDPRALAAIKRMFQKEQRASTILSESEHFVNVLGHGPGYLEMDLVAWPTLEQLLDAPAGPDLVLRRGLDPLEVGRIGVALLRGLEQMHSLYMIHRDLKPGNVFVARHDSGGFDVKIADLGLWVFDRRRAPGKLPGEPRTGLNALAAQDLSFPALPVGTYAYMSPEQMRQESLDARSDLHAVASVLWEAVTGDVPFPVADEHRKRDEQVLRERLAIVHQLPACPPEMPDALYQVLIKALALHPNDRWRSAREMKGALERWVLAEGEVRRSDGEGVRKRLELLEREVAGFAWDGRDVMARFGNFRDRLSLLRRRLASGRADGIDDHVDELRREFERLVDRFRILGRPLEPTRLGVQLPSWRRGWWMVPLVALLAAMLSVAGAYFLFAPRATPTATPAIAAATPTVTPLPPTVPTPAPVDQVAVQPLVDTIALPPPPIATLHATTRRKAASRPRHATAAPVAKRAAEVAPPGQLSHEQVRRGMAAVEDAAAACYRRYHVGGTVLVNATIDGGGRVIDAFARGKFAGTPTGKCVADAARRAHFPSTGHAPQRVLYPFVVDADLE